MYLNILYETLFYILTIIKMETVRNSEIIWDKFIVVGICTVLVEIMRNRPILVISGSLATGITVQDHCTTTNMYVWRLAQGRNLKFGAGGGYDE
jgi:hypothetical protein